MDSPADDGWQVVSGALPGYGHGSPLWDSKRERIVLQYQSFLADGGTTRPTPNTSYYQILSEDDAQTWTPPRDITPFLEPAHDRRRPEKLAAAPRVVPLVEGAAERLDEPGEDEAGLVVAEAQVQAVAGARWKKRWWKQGGGCASGL